MGLGYIKLSDNDLQRFLYEALYGNGLLVMEYKGAKVILKKSGGNFLYNGGNRPLFYPVVNFQVIKNYLIKNLKLSEHFIFDNKKYTYLEEIGWWRVED